MYYIAFNKSVFSCSGASNCDHMNYSLPGSVYGILQARITECVTVPFSSGSTWPRDWPRISFIAGRFFYLLSPQGSSLSNNNSQHKVKLDCQSNRINHHKTEANAPHIQYSFGFFSKNGTIGWLKFFTFQLIILVWSQYFSCLLKHYFGVCVECRYNEALTIFWPNFFKGHLFSDQCKIILWVGQLYILNFTITCF